MKRWLPWMILCVIGCLLTVPSTPVVESWQPGVLATIAIFWAARELLARPWMAGLVSLVFGFLVGGTIPQVGVYGLWIGAIILVVALFRGGPKHLLSGLGAGLGLTYMIFLLAAWRDDGVQYGGYGGVLAIAALAAWARWERITAAPQAPRPASPLDLPATKGTEKADPGRFPAVWLLAAGVLAGLAGAHSVAGGSLLLIVPMAALVMALSGRRPCWWSAAIPGLMSLACSSIVLGSYPSAVSAYRFQIWLGNATGLEAVWSAVCLLGLLFVLLTAKPRGAALTWLVAALVASSLHFSPAYGVEGWFAPATRALAIVVIAGPVIQAVITAVSPRSLQAPKRSNPAPGSLLHQ